MTLTAKMSGREYQRSIQGAPDGTIAANSAALARVQNTSGEFRIATESERGSFFDTAFSFTDDHLGRFITFIADTPPDLGAVSHGSNLELHWTYRILSRVGADELVLEGFRAEFAGTGITYIIHAAFDFSSAAALFPEDLGEGTGTGADGDIRTNTGPVEWQAIHFPEASDDRLQLYPMIVSRRDSLTALRMSDPFDNIDEFPATVGSLQWHLRDRPAYTNEQLYKIIHQFILQCGWTGHQHRGKNNGAGTGGNDGGVFVNLVQDWIYFSDGQNQDTSMYLRMVAGHRMNVVTGPIAGTDNNAVYGIDWALWSSWDRDFAPINLVSGTPDIFSNPGNGVNSLSSNVGTSAINRWASNADADNTANSSEPALSPDSFSSILGAPFHFSNPWGSPFHSIAAARTIRPNALNTFEGGGIQETRYFMIGDKDEITIYIEAPGVGYWVMTMGALQPRVDAQGNNFFTNFRTRSALGTPRVHIGGPGTADGTDPTSVTPPYQIGDRLQMVGQTVNLGIVPTSPTPASAAHAGEFIESSTVTGLPGLTPAIGFINCVDFASLVDNTDIFNVDTGAGFIQFYYDTDGGGGGVGTAIDVSGDTTAADVATTTAGVLNASALLLTATPNGSTVDLVHDTNGGVGNIAMTEGVADAGFTVEGMGGGGYAIDVAGLNNDQEAGAVVGEDPQPMFFFRPWENATPIGVAAASQGTFRVSNRSNHGDGTYFDWNGPSVAPPNSNGFDCVAEVSGLNLADTNEVNPNARSGRFPLMAVNCKDTDGGQIRGSMKFHRLASPFLGAYQFKRDRAGDYHMLLPFGGRHQSSIAISSTTTNHFISAFGPIPSAMAFVG